MKKRYPAKTPFLILTLAVLSASLTSCATANYKIHQPGGAEELKYKKISQADPSFWKDVNSVSAISKTNIGSNGIHAAIGGNIDFGGTCSNVIKSVVPGVLISGLNPIAGAMTIVQVAAEGPQRKKDPTFQENVNAILGSYDWDKYFAEVLQNKLGSPVKMNAYSLGWDRMTRKETDLFMNPNGRNIIYSLSISLEGPVSSQGWTSPNAALTTSVIAFIVGDEALQEIYESDQDKKMVTCFSLSDSYGSLVAMNAASERVTSKLKRLSLYRKAFEIEVFKKSRTYGKEKWLSGNGSFLQDEFRSSLENLAAGLSLTAG